MDHHGGNRRSPWCLLEVISYYRPKCICKLPLEPTHRLSNAEYVLLSLLSLVGSSGQCVVGLSTNVDIIIFFIYIYISLCDHTHSLSLTLTHIHTRARSYTHTHAHAQTMRISPHTHTHVHTHTIHYTPRTRGTHTHTHTHTRVPKGSGASMQPTVSRPVTMLGDKRPAQRAQ